VLGQRGLQLLPELAQGDRFPELTGPPEANLKGFTIKHLCVESGLFSGLTYDVNAHLFAPGS